MESIADLTWATSSHGHTACRTKPAALPKQGNASFLGTKLTRRQRMTPLCRHLQPGKGFPKNHSSNGEIFSHDFFRNPKFGKAKTVKTRNPKRGKGKIFRVSNIHDECLCWQNEGLYDVGLKKSTGRGNLGYGGCGRGDSDGTEFFDELGPKCPTGGSSGGYAEGGGRGGHWNGSGGGGGEDGNDWFFQPTGEGRAYFLFLLGLLNKHAKPAGTKALIPALLMQLFLYRNVDAYADSITSPLKTSSNVTTADSQVNGQEAKARDSQDGLSDAVFVVQGGKWRRLLIDTEKDEFVDDPVKESDKETFASDDHGRNNLTTFARDWGLQRSIKWCWHLVRHLMLPEGYPDCVTGDYLDYTLWRMGQGIASQINGVLTTQALLYAVGLGKGAIPTAAAVNWVLKDGIGYLSKILLAKYGRHFDVHPKGWRLLADLMENASYGLELLTPIYPHLFVYLGAAAGAGRSAAGLIQAATRSCFYAGFAAQRNFAEVIAKGEAQGMVSKSIGIVLGIALSGYAGASGPMLVATFIAVSGAHMLCNLRSYQAVQLRTLNPYRASLVFGEYIRRGVVASVEEVNAEEPIFTEVPFVLFKLTGHKNSGSNLLSLQTKEDAAVIANKLNLGVSFADVIRSQNEADELFKIYQNEQYILVERQNTYQVLLKVGATSHDLLKMMLQVCYLYQLQNGPWRSLAKGDTDSCACSPVETSYKLMVDKFGLLQQELASAGWVTSDGLVSRPLSYRLLEALP